MIQNAFSVVPVRRSVWVKAARLVILTFVFAPQISLAKEISSPNGRITIAFKLQDIANSSQCATYRVTYDGHDLVGDSRLRFRVAKQNPEIINEYLGENLEIISQNVSQHNETWQPIYGERSQVRDHHRQLVGSTNKRSL